MANIIPPRRNESLVDGQLPTTRLSEYLERLADTTNENTAEITSISIENVLSLVNALENRLGSGDALTSDETGFTVDSTTLTVDMTEA